MKINTELLISSERLTIGGAPEGLDALVLAALDTAAADGVLYVATDDARMAAMAQALAFFAPKREVLTLPAWDCLPYDRVSPRAEIASRRMLVLSRLTAAAVRGPIVLTTLNAALQRVPAAAAVRDAVFTADAGESIDLSALTDYLARNGYSRSGTVRESGEYAVRGGLIDIFPPGEAEPIRLDLFGDTLESVRRFDPLSQRTSGGAGGVALVAASEVPLDAASIARFRAGYAERFGVATDDPLYAAIAAGHHYIGMEHWLPLFYERLETVFDYLAKAVLVLDHGAEEASEPRLAAIAETYAARKERAGGSAGKGEARYKPLPPESLYLTEGEWTAHLEQGLLAVLSPFEAPQSTRTATIDAGGRGGRDFAPERNQPGVDLFDAVKAHIAERRGAGRRVVVAGFSRGARERLAGMLKAHGVADLIPVDDWSQVQALPKRAVALAVLGIERGFETADCAFISEPDILGERIARPPRRTRRAENFIAEASSLSPGDFVVHVDHGIGRYEGLMTLDIGGAPHDCLHVTYQGGDRLFVPVENIEVLARFGSSDASPGLDRLGGAAWQARKGRAKKRILEIAHDLIRVAAERRTRVGEPMTPPEGAYDEFCARFAYDETEDQVSAIEDVLADLGSGQPLDRLICGDVGFGKTEVAMRTAFVVASAGRQVALIAPTTLLCRQHAETFRERFAGTSFRIVQLSRLVSAGKAAEARRQIAGGEAQIVIGTHALLGKSVTFDDLALVIVDEEQHFGVAHKERLKKLRADVHVLALSATPIPRTLQMALGGLREMSLIATPPVDRLAVRTYITPFDPVIVREAILREHHRGGQVFYVCPRIADLPFAERFLADEVPEVIVATAHGQMPPRELDAVMQGFYERASNVLVSTNIIESGLDIPTANTLIVHRADHFGLAQLYQLRGRIGRSKVRAYAYLTVPAHRRASADAEKRLRVMQALDDLGAGFSLASYDLDIRGAGNILGTEQSGRIREVGFELYQEMLEEAIASIEGAERTAVEDKFSPQISIGTAVLIPESYVSDLTIRLGLYRRLARLETRAEIDAMAAELIDRFGPLPDEVSHLLEVLAIKHLCRAAGIERLEAGPAGATMTFRNNTFANPAGLVEFVSERPNAIKFRPDHRLVYMRPWETAEARLLGVRRLIERLADVATAAPGGASAA